MHEASIAHGILRGALAALPDGKKITRITIVAGAQVSVVLESLDLYFQELSRGSLAEGALLDLQQRAGKLVCKSCGQIHEHVRGTPVSMICKTCGGANRLDITNELFLESMEVEDLQDGGAK
ncbi:MAG: hydrogenase maturation nickel metallochaperone HypA [Candidatus Riflebacteria bacterium]|nr:hydrogenase maturation nickel metallochaperone HypA [Candidatus Riflebacteria bacterium]